MAAIDRVDIGKDGRGLTIVWRDGTSARFNRYWLRHNDPLPAGNLS